MRTADPAATRSELTSPHWALHRDTPADGTTGHPHEAERLQPIHAAPFHVCPQAKFILYYKRELFVRFLARVLPYSSSPFVHTCRVGGCPPGSESPLQQAPQSRTPLSGRDDRAADPPAAGLVPSVHCGLLLLLHQPPPHLHAPSCRCFPASVRTPAPADALWSPPPPSPAGPY